VDLELRPVALDEAREGQLVARLRGGDARFDAISRRHWV
jgi:hypothetical protein